MRTGQQFYARLRGFNLRGLFRTPFLRVRRLDRVVELSHWGNIAIEETIEVEHVGAQLKVNRLVHSCEPMHLLTI